MLEWIRDALGARHVAVRVAVTLALSSTAPACLAGDGASAAVADGSVSPAVRRLIDTPAAYYPAALQPVTFDGIDFAENDSLGRLFAVRNVSLLTLAESRDARLFLGINREGILGLHYSALSSRNENRYLEFLRLPYLH